MNVTKKLFARDDVNNKRDYNNGSVEKNRKNKA